jgi:hypothetical protein
MLAGLCNYFKELLTNHIKHIDLNYYGFFFISDRLLGLAKRKSGEQNRLNRLKNCCSNFILCRSTGENGILVSMKIKMVRAASNEVEC